LRQLGANSLPRLISGRVNFVNSACTQVLAATKLDPP
jgi:hypothetical protein